MQDLSLCRICLATDVRLCSIASHLQDMYERITTMTFKRDDRRPLVVCYICHARLQNSYRLRTSCLQSEGLFTEMMSSGVLIQDVVSTHSFRVVPVLQLSMGDIMLDSTGCHVKEEALEAIHDAELDQHKTEDIVTEAQQDQYTVKDDNNQCSDTEDHLNIIKIEPDDVETGAGVSKINNIVAVKDTEDTTTNQGKINVEIVTEKTELQKLLETSVLYNVREQKSTNNRSSKHNISHISISKHNNLIKNISRYTSEKSYQCDVCNKCFNKKSNLSTHLRIHTGDKPYQCDFCKKCFNNKCHLITHLRIHTGEKPYQCEVCKKCYSNKCSYSKHLRKHTGERPYQCEVCRKCFVIKHDLSNHLRTHTGEKPYQCNVCNKCFSNKGNLGKHIRTHTGEKPYHCNVCNKCFSDVCSLRKHYRTHTGEKPYQCNVCNKSFCDKSTLNKHSRTFAGKEPYQCDICMKCFCYKRSFITHIRIHTGEKPYECNV